MFFYKLQYKKKTGKNFLLVSERPVLKNTFIAFIMNSGPTFYYLPHADIARRARTVKARARKIWARPLSRRNKSESLKQSLDDPTNLNCNFARKSTTQPNVFRPFLRTPISPFPNFLRISRAE